MSSVLEEMALEQRRLAQQQDSLSIPEVSDYLVAHFLGLPGLRGLWSMASFDQAGNAIDYSGQVRTLTYVGNPVYNWINLVPYFELDGTGDYLARADEAGLRVLASEAYVATAAQGITLYIWSWFDNAVGADEYLINKWAGGGQQSYRLMRDAAGDADFSIIDGGAALRQVQVAGGLVDVDEWAFVAGRLDRDGNTIDIAVGSDAGYSTNSLAVPAATVIANSNADLRIGADGVAANLMTGRVSVAALYATGHDDAIMQSVFEETRGLFRV
jgi:hypothetical protein